MAMTIRTDASLPLSQMNTTPLVDVMLVLLILFIVTMPIATHSVDIDIGGGLPAEQLPVDPVINRVEVTAGDQIVWNGEAIDDAQLRALLQTTRRLPVEPELQFRADALASYERAARTLAAIKRSGVTKFGFVGNERFADLGR